MITGSTGKNIGRRPLAPAVFFVLFFGFIILFYRSASDFNDMAKCRVKIDTVRRGRKGAFFASGVVLEANKRVVPNLDDGKRKIHLQIDEMTAGYFPKACKLLEENSELVVWIEPDCLIRKQKNFGSLIYQMEHEGKMVYTNEQRNKAIGRVSDSGRQLIGLIIAAILGGTLATGYWLISSGALAGDESDVRGTTKPQTKPQFDMPQGPVKPPAAPTPVASMENDPWAVSSVPSPPASAGVPAEPTGGSVAEEIAKAFDRGDAAPRQVKYNEGAYGLVLRYVPPEIAINGTLVHIGQIELRVTFQNLQAAPFSIAKGAVPKDERAKELLSGGWDAHMAILAKAFPERLFSVTLIGQVLTLRAENPTPGGALTDAIKNNYPIPLPAPSENLEALVLVGKQMAQELCST